MNVLITGAAGFVGSHLVDRYLADGHAVVGIDNLLSGVRENLAHALRNPRFTFLEADLVASGSDLTSSLEGAAGRADLVLHFASPASPADYAAYPLETMMVNSIGTDWCCKAALGWHARLLFASTSESYGDPLQHPQTEDYAGNVNPVGPRACYDESKRFGEALVSTYMRSTSLDGRIVRIFNTYGPRMRPTDGRVVSTFIRQALAKEPLTIYGDGAQTRSLCYVSDLIEGIVRCAASDAARGLVINLGNPQERTILEIAQTVCHVVGIDFVQSSKPLPEGDPKRRCPDISRARRLLGWEPRVGLEDGLRKTIESFAAGTSGVSQRAESLTATEPRR